MKEHRTKALRVTTPHCISSSVVVVSNAEKNDLVELASKNANAQDDVFGTLQLFQLEIVSSSSCCSITPTSSNSTGFSTATNQFTKKDNNCLSGDDNLATTPITTKDDGGNGHFQNCNIMTTDTATLTSSPPFASSDVGRHSYHRHHRIEIASSSSSSSAIFFEDNDNRSDNVQLMSTEDSCSSGGGDGISNGSPSTYVADDCDDNLPTVGCEQIENNVQRSPTVLEIVSGNLLDNWPFKLQHICETIDRCKSRNNSNRDAWWQETNKFGNNALLVSGQKLLFEEEFDKADEIASLMLREGAYVDSATVDNRTLLSYSILHMDYSIKLTTTLLNYGANFWPLEVPPDSNYNSLNTNNNNGREYDNAFTWFLIGVIRHRKLDEHCLKTLHLLSEAMSEDPRRMYAHVMATLFRNAGNYYRILGPVFLQIKLVMRPYWTQPRTLKQLCRSVIRRSFLRHSTNTTAPYYTDVQQLSKLRLPPPLQSYILFQS